MYTVYYISQIYQRHIVRNVFHLPQSRLEQPEHSSNLLEHTIHASPVLASRQTAKNWIGQGGGITQLLISDLNFHLGQLPLPWKIHAMLVALKAPKQMVNICQIDKLSPAKIHVWMQKSNTWSLSIITVWSKFSSFGLWHKPSGWKLRKHNNPHDLLAKDLGGRQDPQ